MITLSCACPHEDDKLMVFEWAVQLGDPIVLSTLLDNASLTEGVVTNASEKIRFVLLHTSCQLGHEQCARVLLVAKADPNEVDEQGQTALMMACASESDSGR